MAKKIKSVKKSSTPTLTASVGTPTINRTIRLEAKDYIGAQTPKDLIQRNGKLYCFDKVSDRTLFKQEYYDHGMPWRGYRFFDAYSEAQITAIIKLINLLCKQFKIPKSTPANHFDADDEYRQFAGILGHHHLRPDKSDIHPGFPWQRVIDEVGLALL